MIRVSDDPMFSMGEYDIYHFTKNSLDVMHQSL